MAETTFSLTKKLTHIAFIMDGNGRWAKARGLARHYGHKEACRRLREIFDTCLEFKIRYASYYAFSTENWNRPQDEIDHLMDYLEEFFHREIDYLDSKGCKVLISGDLSRIRERTRKVCYEAMERTKNNDVHIANICLNYGGRDELLNATKELIKEVENGSLKLEDLKEEDISKHLFNPEVPDIDLLIRTSGEQRISNYQLWRLAYAEFVFTPVAWPDFHREQMIDCLKEYCGRSRRYGGLKNE